MDELCDLRHIPIGSEMIYSESNTKLARSHQRLDSRHVTVERLHDLGVLDNVERPYLLKLKGIFDEQVKIAAAEVEKLPFASPSPPPASRQTRSSRTTITALEMTDPIQQQH
jgi:hypothetical protein